MSIKHSFVGDNFVPGTTALTTCSPNTALTSDPRNYLSVDKSQDNTVVFTYDVIWEDSDIEWSQRWDTYLNADAPNEKVHWFAITNSIMIVLFLTVMIAMILIRALRKVSCKIFIYIYMERIILCYVYYYLYVLHDYCICNVI